MTKYIQSIERACDILDFISQRRSVRLNELTQEFGLAKTTIFGILRTLEHKQMIAKDENANYCLGIKNYAYGKVFESGYSLKKIVHPFLEQLVAEFNETVHLAVEQDNKAMYADLVKSTHNIRHSATIGGTDPLYCSSVGKLMLAYMSEDELDTYFNAISLQKMTSKTNVDSERLKQELQSIRERGYSLDNEELETGLICVSAPLFKGDKFVAAICISGPINRIDGTLFADMQKSICEKAAYISTLI